MNITQSHRQLVRRSAVLLLVVIPILAACGSAESKKMKAIAGNYVTLFESDETMGTGEPFATQRTTLTLRPDGRWVQRVESSIGGEERLFTDSGAYRVEGTMIALAVTEASPPMRMTVSGDTLWTNASANIRLTEAVTGLKMDDTGEQAFLVRQR